MKRKSRLVVLLVVLSLVLTGGAIVWAQSEPSLDEAASEGELQHCIAQVDVAADDAATDAGGEEALAASPAPAAACFATFAEAVYAASSGAIQLPAGVTAETMTDEMLQPAIPAATTIVGIDYASWLFGGSTFTWFATNSVGCLTGLSYLKSSPPSGWNDVVSSARAFGGCARFYHFEHANFGGAVLKCPSNWCSVFGAMNNRTSSWRWYRDGFHY